MSCLFLSVIRRRFEIQSMFVDIMPEKHTFYICNNITLPIFFFNLFNYRITTIPHCLSYYNSYFREFCNYFRFFIKLRLANLKFIIFLLRPEDFSARANKIQRKLEIDGAREVLGVSRIR